MTKFEVGQTYSVRSTGDHDCTYKYTVIRRTEKSVWLSEVGGDENCKGVRRRVFFDQINLVEKCYPDGRYSKCPVLSASPMINLVSARGLDKC